MQKYALYVVQMFYKTFMVLNYCNQQKKPSPEGEGGPLAVEGVDNANFVYATLYFN